MGHWFLRYGWRHLVGAAAVVVALFPLVFVAAASVNPSGTLTGSNDLFADPTAAHYRTLFTDPLHPFGSWFANSMAVGVTTAAGSVFLGACAAYAFSRFRFRGRRAGLLGLVFVQLFPQLLAYVAIFLLLSELKDVFPAIGLGSRLGLVMVYLGGALGVNTYLMKGFFDTVPKELDESAQIDGASHAQVFFRVLLPLVAPILVVVALFSFVATLNDFVIAGLVLTDPDQQTLAVGLYQLVSYKLGQNWGVFAAGALIGALPVLVLFQFLQRFIVGGLTSGAVKS
ncbi:sugar ABC transporter permease [Streptosporangium roseum]|uniref:Maltose/maltodextrin transport system (Permease) n=1 Tax=Streptosporangium roseum (strain ATCC 12428 / DSM 43021 / JCM 3005 / KCTC 9067 / NCIMB 10171 / NRRL 2505 / NI 9100) TaxID=479432 RepID=D2B815_STRRD|nr:ABC transporter permease subunit [Streptosporangium roseum]ACZ83946.1 maltose/maltodextrin transport system (permease) [Streptosporangium roseum DSM 43021]